ncbi:MAG: response regulator [Elusimicrobia bacterium]|nr:response regulator [Elusimicrobiota bacterium]
MSDKKILIVDDDFSVRETITDILKSQGWLVEGVPTGREAVEKTEEKNFDCVILDLRLPDFNGFEIIERIKNKVDKSKIVVITGYATDRIIVDALSKAEYFLLLKPVEPKQLISVVGKILEQ